MEPAMQCCRTRGAAGARQHEARSRATEGFLRLDLREGPDSVPHIDLKVGFGGRHAWSQGGRRLLEAQKVRGCDRCVNIFPGKKKALSLRREWTANCPRNSSTCHPQPSVFLTPTL